MAIYTKRGDEGQTDLFSGQRISKSSSVIDFIGTLDELNSILGLCVSSLDEEDIDFSDEAEVLESIQEDLFKVGALSSGAKLAFNPQTETENIEKTIDDYEKLLSPLKTFILPGGSVSSSFLHLARTQVRKTEREAIGLKSQSLTPFLPYLNRLSDLLFVMARFVNKKTKTEERFWKK